MRLIRIILAAVVGLFALIAAGFVAVLVVIGGAIGLILSRLGLIRGNIKVNVQRQSAARPGPQSHSAGTRMHAPDAIDVETTPVGGVASAAAPRELPGDRPAGS